MIWEKVEIGDVVEKIIGGGTPSKSCPEYWNGNIPWCSVKDMLDDRFQLSQTEDYITEDGLKNSASNLIPAGTIITATRMGLGRAFINTVDMAINQDLKAVLPNARIDKKFLLWLIVSKRDEIEGLGTGATVKGIRLETFKGIKLHLPPLPIQKRIAEILSAYDDLIENNGKRITLLEELAQRTYEEWFVRFRVNGEQLPIDDSTGLPVGWEKRKIGDVYKTSSGGTPSRKKEELYYNNGTINWIKTKELNNTLIIDSEEKITELAVRESSAKLFPPGTVLLAMYGNTIGETGYLTITAATNQACCAFLFNHHIEGSYYMHQFLIANKSKVLGYRMGAAQENISQEIVKAIEIVHPTAEIINSFAKLLSPIYNMVECLTKKNYYLKESRDILLPRLMNGTINVTP